MNNKQTSDLLDSRLFNLLIYWVPAMVLVGSASAPLSSLVRAEIWAAALTVMGIGCLINAARCGRMHCYFTGPYFLIMAAAALTYGLGALPLGARGWTILTLVTLIGGVVLCFAPERLLGRYRYLR